MIDCAIIGAGLAGLVAARNLIQRGLTVVVLEARDRVGGRVENANLGDGQYVELGGQWVGPGFDSLAELTEYYGLEMIDIPPTGNLVVRLRGQNLQVPSAIEGPQLTPFEVSDLGQGLLRLRRLAERFRKDAAWAQSNHVWLEQDLMRWISTNLRTRGARQRFAEVYEAAYGSMSKDASLGEGLRQVMAGPDLETMLASSGGLHQKRIAGGAHALPEAIADELGDVVRLSTPVEKVSHRADGATLHLAGGEQVEARQVLSTLPPRLAVSLQHEPPLAPWRSEVASKVSPGNVIKAFLIYESPFWHERGLSGQSSADTGAIRVTLDASVADSPRGLLMGFFEGAEADSLSRRSSTLRERAFTDAVKATFGDDVPKPMAYVERDWSAEPYTAGCHGAHFAPGAWSADGPLLAEPDGVLHWAGAEYSSRFNGYMEGAVRSGLEAAAAVARDCA
ncbi:flavin monoamine oxidase family protein [Tessaracoccus caeni]|uniref:flavin monoamine oxidase family protein n=1 Tax=Tessaracoccus caeni TaxID=3031239 RepID=UPI0023DB152F|nr:FAD-dependent oxidoreductase [Tessaracoccus caeni]MDF1487690.1 FAD-dependent oxidoreductase [Tessaracoccus caeni]